MAQVEKTIFISYRRADVYTALAVYENLKNQGYDVFFDYRSISSGDFEQIITSNIRARAHFLLILTPTALDRCNEQGDWLRREIETAIDERRNIVPLFFKGFRFGDPFIHEKMTGKLKNLSRYNGLNVHEDYFDEAMQRLGIQYLNIPLDTVLHPVSTEIQKVVRAEQVAADKALEQIEDVQDLVKQIDEKPVQLTKPDPMPVFEKSVSAVPTSEKPKEPPSNSTHNVAPKRNDAQTKYDEVPKEHIADFRHALKKAKSKAAFPFSLPVKKISIPNLNYRLFGGIAGGILLFTFLILGGVNIFRNQFTDAINPAPTSQGSATQAFKIMETNAFPPTKTPTSQPIKTNTPSSTKTSIPPTPTPTPGIGSTLTSEKDGMTLLYVPAGEFTMGSNVNTDEQPIHQVYLDAFWIDATEVTNKMYMLCVDAGICKAPTDKRSFNRSSYYGNSNFDSYPVLFADWNKANTYCGWADRRLPTEAEWEKAARGTDGRTYPWGEKIDCSLANYWGEGIYNCVGDTDQVGNYPDGASIYGALDMAGNVSEWVNDFYSETYYQNAPSSNPLGPDSGQFRLLRGGSWLFGGGDVRSTDRFGNDPTRSNTYFGFRCAMNAIP